MYKMSLLFSVAREIPMNTLHFYIVFVCVLILGALFISAQKARQEVKPLYWPAVFWVLHSVAFSFVMILRWAEVLAWNGWDIFQLNNWSLAVRMHGLLTLAAYTIFIILKQHRSERRKNGKH